MKLLPRFKEDEGIKCSSSISLTENLNFLTPEDAERISAYMESCVVIDEWLSSIKNPINGRLEIPSKTWSDGEYAWDSSHIHYVKNYRARLPNEFFEHVKKRLEIGFEGASLSRVALREEFEGMLDKLLAGDESVYARY